MFQFCLLLCPIDQIDWITEEIVFGNGNLLVLLAPPVVQIYAWPASITHVILPCTTVPETITKVDETLLFDEFATSVTKWCISRMSELAPDEDTRGQVNQQTSTQNKARSMQNSFHVLLQTLPSQTSSVFLCHISLRYLCSLHMFPSNDTSGFPILNSPATSSAHQ